MLAALGLGGNAFPDTGSALEASARNMMGSAAQLKRYSQKRKRPGFPETWKVIHLPAARVLTYQGAWQRAFRGAMINQVPAPTKKRPNIWPASRVKRFAEHTYTHATARNSLPRQNNFAGTPMRKWISRV